MFNSSRCGNCGFLNFATASECKRCKAKFAESTEAGSEQPSGGYETSWQPGYQTGFNYPQPVYQAPYYPMPLAPLPRVSKNGATNAGLWILLGLAVVIALSIAVLWKFGRSSSVTFSWQEYKPQDGSYTVMLPKKPIESSQTLSGLSGQVQMYMSATDMREQGAYLVGYVNYPESVSKLSTDTLLDMAAQGAMNESGATMVSQKSITLDGYKGLEIEMSIPPEKFPGNGRGICRIYWAAPRMYVLVVAGPESSEVYTTRAKFLDSFHLSRRLVSISAD